jgi:O-acetyl-ADP-ribose deacetylase (regulator of RNase III)
MESSMAEHTDYSIGDATFTITYADIISLSVDAVVSSDDNYLSMGGGVSAAISRAAGPSLISDARKHIPLALGDVAVTGAGELAAKYVFHGVTIDRTNMILADADNIRGVTHRCLEISHVLGVRRIAFPALGIGTAGVASQPCAEAMTREIASFLSSHPTSVEHVTLALYARPGLAWKVQNFYAKSAELAVQWTASRRLRWLLGELDLLLPNDSTNVGIHSELQRLRVALASAEDFLADPLTSIGDVTVSQDRAALGPLSKEAEKVISRSQEVVDWENVKAQEKILQARLESLRTQENAMYGNRNRLEEQKARFAPAQVPLDLLNAIDDIQTEITRIGSEISDVKSALATTPSTRTA